MKNIRCISACLSVWVLTAAFFCSEVAAGSAVETAKKSFSANENYLKRFRKEREALAQASDADSVKKRDNLDKKIKNLEMENARLEGIIQKDKSPSASAVSPKPVEPKPVSSSAVTAPPAAESSKLVPLKPVLRTQGLAVSEWDKMSREEKENYVQSLVSNLKRDGKVIERHPLFYTALMDYVFVSDSELSALPLKDAVIVTIQKNEPSLRASKN